MRGIGETRTFKAWWTTGLMMCMTAFPMTLRFSFVLAIGGGFLGTNIALNELRFA